MSLDLTTQSTTEPTPSAVPFPTAAPVAQRSDCRGRARSAATLAAVTRDLDRLSRVLTQPVTSVRRAALVVHVGYLVDQLRDAEPELADRCAGTLSRFRHEARRWSREPGRRSDLLAATEHSVTALAPSVAGGRTLPVGPGGSLPTRLLDLAARRPTTLAYRHFWLLDGLPPQQAEAVAREFTAATRWVLRNVLSGGYNRRAYLMWIGGGSGPAI